MRKTSSGAKGKGKQPAKPVQTLVKFFLTEKHDIDALNEVKKISRTEVSSKAVIEALHNYPKLVKRADGLNSELQKINRDHEQVVRDMETVRRAFNIIIGTAPKPKPKADHDDDDDDDDDGICVECGNDNFWANGQCSECGTDKNA